jgi:hypothetical protein
MLNHGKVRAVECPEPITIDDFSVWVAENIAPVTVAEENGNHTEYEFDLFQYEKDEYIHGMIDKNASLEAALDDTMLALCDVYEMLDAAQTVERDE